MRGRIFANTRKIKMKVNYEVLKMQKGLIECKKKLLVS